MTTEDDRKYAEQTAQIKRRFDPVMTEPIPARMYLKSPPWIDYARAAVVFGAGVAIGLAMPGLLTPIGMLSPGGTLRPGGGPLALVYPAGLIDAMPLRCDTGP